MGLRSTPGFPHKGWTLDDVIDTQLDRGLEYGDYPCCQFCDQDQIRFVHLLKHPGHHQAVEVGCDCAEHMTQDYKNPRRRERELRNRAARRVHFPHRRWKISSQGNPHIEYRGYHAVIFLRQGKYRVKIGSTIGKKSFDSLAAAKLAVFDGIEWALNNGTVL
jgi:hypothetical protein